MKIAVLVVLCGSAAFPVSAAAQETSEPAAPQSANPDDTDTVSEVIVVRAGGLDRLDILASTSMVDDFQLERDADGQIGEVLAKLPGVSATSFSPGASRPVLRGLQGDRVRVLTDGIGSIDASSTSADHAVAINPLLADRVEVLRGPATLLFGSSAIGGAVNVIDRRIPTEKPEGGARLDTLASTDTAYDLREAGASGDVTLGRAIVLHADGSYRTTNDVEVPGYVLAPPLREELLAEAAARAAVAPGEAAELRSAADRRDVLPNSATETYTLGAGLGYVTPDVNFGASVGYYDTFYGVPERPGPGPAQDAGDGAAEEGGVAIGLKQWRGDFRGQIHLGEGGVFHDIIARAGYSDYTHTEFEGAETGTVFDVEGVEARLELIQNERALGENADWRGSLGGQYGHTDFVATGEEAFVPPNVTENAALFALQEVDIGAFEAELGARYERTDITENLDGRQRDFDTISGALGLSWTFDNDVRVGVNLSRAERAPTAEELFARGPHVATQQFEIGDPDLDTEGAFGLEGCVQARLAGADIRLAAYRNAFRHFIYLAETGQVRDDLPVFRHAQQDATFTGFETEATAPLLATAAGELVADAHGSYVRAKLEDGSPVPRIPPLGLGGGVEWQARSYDLRAEIDWTARQDRIAAYETPTDGFTFVNLSARWRPLGTDRVTVLVQAENLFDATGRRHASFTKDYVPLAGRNVKLTLRTRL
ncbi:TonB-dependent receptor [Aurantiacibacter spongiae]|uniref:TonB-dependent receptor n=1 Tax=Aurantiacibacter spongiae TaxID=2488860 RepID=A0A3N5D9B5_9SPHN|nr:TonB-dependent receptor [Aurantiacibacter spongiae]RPF71198.1 TonB-dependent receptor [Aurantiacibacter spongiae]